MNDDRTNGVGGDRGRILSMLAEGKITAAEAEQLLVALDARATKDAGAAGDAAAAGAASSGGAKPFTGTPKFLYVKVVSTGGDNVDIRVPLGLLRAGLKLTSLIPSDVMDQINESMREHGISLDVANLKQEDVEELIKNLREMEINVDAKNGDNVRIYCG